MFFQNSVIKKYLAGLNAEQVTTAWEQYKAYFLNREIQDNIRSSKEEQFQEGFLRELFVKVLGYTLNPLPNFNLITEQKNETDGKKADGAILHRDSNSGASPIVIGVIELKDHKTTDLSHVERQAFGYKNQHKDTRYVIISNFEKLRFYIDNAVEHIEWNLFTLTEQDFRLLYFCLAWPNICADLPLKAKQDSVSNEDQITQQLYKDYSAFKREMFADILANNTDENTPQEQILLLFRKTQKLLDRLLFIFFAEDCGLLPPNSMVEILQQWEKLKEMDAYFPLYDRIKKYFGYMDTGWQGKKYEIFAYNGGLFKPDEVLDAIRISDDILARFTRKLASYDYSTEVDVNILGHIFENSLTEIEEVTAQLSTMGHAPLSQPQPIAKRKRDGVFYTPQYITKYIIENTVGRLCAEKKAEMGIDEAEYFADKNRRMATKKRLLDQLTKYRDWLLDITICDPACGSGAFLNAALQFLMAEHKLIDEMEAKITNSAIVFQEIENSILENNLYGVDINEESVEIARLALWLRTAKPHRKLNSLNNNIKCGNSLISDPEIAGEKAFDWQKEFPQVFREKQKKAWHITTATHDSRTSQRMIDYKVRLLRDHGMRPYADPMWLDPMEERIVTETISEIVKADRLNVLAYNVCGDHMHLVLVCEEEEIPKIVGKIKSMTARAVNIAMGRTVPTGGETTGQTTAGHAPLSREDDAVVGGETTGHAPLSERPTRGETQCSLWTRKYGCEELDSNEYLYNAIEYVKNNREKHELPPLENIGIVPTVSVKEAFRPEYDGGFDVVIGNPPYVQLQSMGEMSDVYAQCGYEVYHKMGDLYCLFYEQGCKLLKENGYLGFIASNKWLKINYGESLRKYLVTKMNPLLLVDFPGVPVFEDATVDPQILIVQKQKYNGKTFACAIKAKDENISDFVEYNKMALNLTSEPWTIRDGRISNILTKMDARDKALKDLPIDINYGVKTGYNEAFFIDEETRKRLIKEDPKSEELIKPLLRGRDISAWYSAPSGQYMISTFPALSLNIDEYPTIKNHLLSFGFERLEQSGKPGSRKKSVNKWFETQDPINYYNDFASAKIVYPNMTKYLPFSYDETGAICNDKAFIITSKDKSFSLKYLLAILNTSIVKFWIRCVCPELGEDRREVRKVYFENLHIPETDQQPFIDLADRMLALNKDLQSKRARFLRRLKDNMPDIKITGTLETFDTLDFAGFVAELKKQKIKLSLVQQDEWEEYFGQYKAELNEISAQIAATDKEIDERVYALYGLTEEEIRVIEA